MKNNGDVDAVKRLFNNTNFTNSFAKTGKLRTDTWDNLCRDFDVDIAVKIVKKTDTPAFIGGKLDKNRRGLEHVIHRSLIVLDLDNGGFTLDSIAQKAKDFGYPILVYTTSSSTLLAPRVRIVIPLAKDISPIDYGNAVIVTAEKLGVTKSCDIKSSKQPAQLMFYPSYFETNTVWSVDYMRDSDEFFMPDISDMVPEIKNRIKRKNVALATKKFFCKDEAQALLDAYPLLDSADIPDPEGNNYYSTWLTVGIALYHNEEILCDAMGGILDEEELHFGLDMWREWTLKCKRWSESDVENIEDKWVTFDRDRYEGTDILTLSSIESKIESNRIVEELTDLFDGDDMPADSGRLTVVVDNSLPISTIGRFTALAGGIKDSEKYNKLRNTVFNSSYKDITVADRETISTAVHKSPWSKANGISLRTIKKDLGASTTAMRREITDSQLELIGNFNSKADIDILHTNIRKHPDKVQIRGEDFLSVKDDVTYSSRGWLNGVYFNIDTGMVYTHQNPAGVSIQAFNQANKPEPEPSSLKMSPLDYGRANGMLVVNGEVYEPALKSRFVLKSVHADPVEIPNAVLINTYKDNRVKPAKDYTTEGKRFVDLFVQHIHNLCREDEEFDVIMDWICFNYINPGSKIRWAPLIQGPVGIGKTFISDAMSMLLGEGGVKVIGNTEISSAFNGWSTGALIGTLEEARVYGPDRYDVMEKLKPAITNSIISVVRKGKDAITINNYMNYIIFTNHKDALVLHVGDRRYYVIYAPTTIEYAEFGYTKDDYFNALFEGIEQYTSELAKFIVERGVSDNFNQNLLPRDTEAKRIMMEASTSSAMIEVKYAIEDYTCDVVNDRIVDITYLAKRYKAANNNLPFPETRNIKAIMLELGYLSNNDRIAVKGSSERHRYYYKDGENVNNVIDTIKRFDYSTADVDTSMFDVLDT